MMIKSEALRRLTAQVAANTGVLVGGTPVQAQRLFAEATSAMVEQATVVGVASPLGELSLSALIAQLSGRLDPDEQDDAALDRGFKRLTGAGRTVWLLHAPAGLGRSALRYVQHVALRAPGLVIVMYRAPALAAMLEEPQFETLRQRLHESPVLEFDAPAPPAAGAADDVPAPIFASLPHAAPLSMASPWPSRPVLWAASALGVAALAGVLWFGHSAIGLGMAGNKSARAVIQRETAAIPVPALAGSPAPVAADVPLPTEAAAAAPALAAPVRSGRPDRPPVVLASLPPPPLPEPLLSPSIDPVLAFAGLDQPTARADRTPRRRRPDMARRETPRLARSRLDWSARPQDRGDYQTAQPYDGVSPIWVRRDPRRGDGYLGTYAVDPHGIRVFQYEP